VASLTSLSKKLNTEGLNFKSSYAPALWFLPKARYLFDISVEKAWDPKYGGLSYSFEPSGEVMYNVIVNK
jgi:mannose/cellobiose epimerase-like protein (N-acyl-D-glucosamine 2-epimerase family)